MWISIIHQSNLVLTLSWGFVSEFGLGNALYLFTVLAWDFVLNSYLKVAAEIKPLCWSLHLHSEAHVPETEVRDSVQTRKLWVIYQVSERRNLNLEFLIFAFWRLWQFSTQKLIWHTNVCTVCQGINSAAICRVCSVWRECWSAEGLLLVALV